MIERAERREELCGPAFTSCSSQLGEDAAAAAGDAGRRSPTRRRRRRRRRRLDRAPRARLSRAMPASLVAPHRLASAAAVRWRRAMRADAAGARRPRASRNRREIVRQSALHVRGRRTNDLLADGKRVDFRVHCALQNSSARGSRTAAHLYYTEPVRTLGDGSLLEHAPGWRRSRAFRRNQRAGVAAIVGGLGGRAHAAHYDVADNTVRPRRDGFWLWPPSAAGGSTCLSSIVIHARGAGRRRGSADRRATRRRGIGPPHGVHMSWRRAVRSALAPVPPRARSRPRFRSTCSASSPLKRAAAAALGARRRRCTVLSPAPLNPLARGHSLRATLYRQIGDGLGEAPPAPAAFVAGCSQLGSRRSRPRRRADRRAAGLGPPPPRAPPVPSWDDLEPALEAHAESAPAPSLACATRRGGARPPPTTTTLRRPTRTRQASHLTAAPRRRSRCAPSAGAAPEELAVIADAARRRDLYSAIDRSTPLAHGYSRRSRRRSASDPARTPTLARRRPSRIERSCKARQPRAALAARDGGGLGGCSRRCSFWLAALGLAAPRRRRRARARSYGGIHVEEERLCVDQL